MKLRRIIMGKNTFSVSIKGILYQDGKYLLRKNQRNEFELLGGRLEVDDVSPEDRVIKEFLEESGVEIKVETHREPWLYEIAKKNIIIVPYLCTVLKCPRDLEDKDGGTIYWVEKDALDAIHMPIGYLDSIRNIIPRKGFSPLPGDYFKIIPNYTEKDYFVKIILKNLDGEIVIDDYLEHFVAPRDLLRAKMKEKYNENNIISLPISKERDTVIINYLLI